MEGWDRVQAILLQINKMVRVTRLELAKEIIVFERGLSFLLRRNDKERTLVWTSIEVVFANADG